LGQNFNFFSQNSSKIEHFFNFMVDKSSANTALRGKKVEKWAKNVKFDVQNHSKPSFIPKEHAHQISAF
jgi:hypothetical protein